MPERQDDAVDAALDGEQPLLGPLIRQAFRWCQDAVQARLADRDEPPLSLTQFEIFGRVDWTGTSISELARRMGTTRQSAHQAVGELARLGLLRVDPDPASSRSKQVRPTERAAERMRAVREALAEAEQTLATRLGTDTVELLRDILGRDWGDPRTR